MIDISNFFKELHCLPYCVVKISENFPNLRHGEDIDIFCYSVEELITILVRWGNGYVSEGYEIKVDDVCDKRHVHVDFCREEKLIIRFDLYGQLPYYKKLNIKPALFESIVENAVETTSALCTVKVPSPIDDLIIKYLEFMEWYDVRPEKIKHLDFILRNSDELAKNKFLQKLHHYTALPPVCPGMSPEIKPSISFFSRFTKRLMKK